MAGETKKSKSKSPQTPKGFLTQLSTFKIWIILALFLLTIIYTLWKYIQIQQEEAIKSEENSSWIKDVISKLLKSKSEEHQNSPQISSKLWNSIIADFDFAKQWTLDFISGQLNFAVSIVIQIICGILLLLIIITYIVYFFWNTRKQNISKKNRPNNSSSPHLQPLHLSVKSVIGVLSVLALIISIPIEYMRQYQEQVASKFAMMKGGVPRECYPQEMSFTETLKHWINWELSWSHEPCVNYHKAVMVDPLWEISPLLVLWSVLVKGILHPIELFFSSIGKSFKLFFSEIPAHWQPLMFIFIVLVVISVVFMSFNYRIYLPFLGRIEPKTPQPARTISYTCEGDKPCKSICDKKS